MEKDTPVPPPANPPATDRGKVRVVPVFLAHVEQKSSTSWRSSPFWFPAGKLLFRFVSFPVRLFWLLWFRFSSRMKKLQRERRGLRGEWGDFRAVVILYFGRKLNGSPWGKN